MQDTRCFDIGGTKIVAADVSINGDCTEQARIPTPTQSYESFVQVLKAHCPDNTAPVGLSVAGVIQPDTGLIESAKSWYWPLSWEQGLVAVL